MCGSLFLIISTLERKRILEEYFRVGVIANTHGIRGEVKVYPTTQDPMRFKGMKEIFIDTGTQKLAWEVANARFSKNMVILKFRGIDSINDIEKYKGKDLFVSRENAIPLEEGEYYIADLIGAKVITEDGEEFGILKDVMETGANDVYVVEHQGREVLLPVIPDCILDRNLEEKIVTVHIMEGLL